MSLRQTTRRPRRQNITIYTDDPRETQEVVSRLYPDVDMRRTPNNAVHVNGHVEDAGRIVKQLVGKNITVNALIPEGETLENYFVKLMGTRGLLNLLRADFYKLKKSKAFWICTLVGVALAVLMVWQCTLESAARRPM